MRTLVNAEYQLHKIMPSAKQKGCKCEFSEKDFQGFIDHKWEHDKNCVAKFIENLPNVKLLEALRA